MWVLGIQDGLSLGFRLVVNRHTTALADTTAAVPHADQAVEVMNSPVVEKGLVLEQQA